MTRLRRLPAANDVQHLYQRSKDRGIIYYSQRDRIVFVTVFYHLCRKYGLRPLGLCIMMTHFHITLRCGSKATISSFMRDLESIFAKEYNAYYGRTGPLFRYRFGQSAKHGLKNSITILNYLYNNPVAAGLCMRAEDYRWGFLPYRHDDHPFSQAYVKRHSSRRLNGAISAATYYLNGDNYLGYELIDSLFQSLDDSEKQQLTDRINSLCVKALDFDGLVSYYGDWETMLMAMFSNTGSEYELKEEAEGKADKRCLELIRFAARHGLPSRRRHFCSISKVEIRKLAIGMMKEFNAWRYDIERVLHIRISQLFD